MLSRIRSKRKKRKFIVYDLEWIPSKLEVRLIGTYDGQKYRAYYTVDDFIDGMLVWQNHEKWFYAHYGGMADSQFILQALTARAKKDGFQIDASFSGSSAIIINVKKGSYSWHFVDSFWLLRDRLAKIGEAVGLEKLGEDYACENFPNCDPSHVEATEEKYLEPCRCGHTFRDHPRGQKPRGGASEAAMKLRPCEREGCDCAEFDGEDAYPLCVFTAPMSKLKVYNERDCVILYRAIEQFERTLLYLGGQLQMTIASCAMHLFRRKYLGENIPTSPWVN